MRSWIVVVLAIAGTGCRKEGQQQPPQRQEQVAQPVAQDAPAEAIAAPPVDAAVDAGVTPDANLTAVAWPTSVQMEIVEGKPLSKTLQVDTSIPRFRTKPGELAAELNERFATYVKLDSSYKTYVGTHYARCSAAVLNRFAAIFECSKMFDARSAEAHAAGTGGSPAGPDPDIFAFWLQPGLPAIELDQLAPGLDAAVLIAAGVKDAPAKCQEAGCEYAPASFSIDAEGIVFRPKFYCSTSCDDEHLPRIPFDQLAPTHPWAVKLVDRLRKRVAAGESLVEGGPP